MIRQIEYTKICTDTTLIWAQPCFRRYVNIFKRSLPLYLYFIKPLDNYMLILDSWFEDYQSFKPLTQLKTY